MPSTAIVGSAVLPGAIYAQPEEDLVMRAVVMAVRDAGLTRQDIGAVVAMTPRPYTIQQYQTQHISTRLGLAVETVCELDISAVGVCNALLMAQKLIETHDYKAVAIWGASRESSLPTAEWFGARTSRTSDASFTGAFGMAPMVWNALGACEMIAAGEATELDYANVAVRLRRQGTLNPFSYWRKEVTAEQVLESRMVAAPLRLLMVCPRTDGAGCIIVAREDIAKRNPGRAVEHVVQVAAHNGDNILPERAGRPFWTVPATTAAMNKLMNKTGLAHDAIDVVEPWIPFAPMEVMVMRGLGFARDYTKQVVVSPSGGLVSRGHPLLATGFYSWHEIVSQVRGEAGTRQVDRVRHAITVTETGNYDECVIDVFKRFDGTTTTR